MIDAVNIQKFWAGFIDHLDPPGVLGTAHQLEQAAGHLSKFAPPLTAECVEVRGGLELTITANGVLRHFPMARAVAAGSPGLPGLQVRALRAARPIAETIRFGTVETPVENVRVHVHSLLSRSGILLLTSGVKIDDYVLFRNCGQRIVMDVVGEDRFGAFVTDVQVMDHADWDVGAEGASSHPLSELLHILPPAPAVPRRAAGRMLEVIETPRQVA